MEARELTAAVIEVGGLRFAALVEAVRELAVRATAVTQAVGAPSGPPSLRVGHLRAA